MTLRTRSTPCRYTLLALTALLGSCARTASESRTASAAEGSSQVLTQRLEAIVPGLLEEALVPGVAIGVIHDHRVIYQRGFGQADVARKTPVTISTRFNVGSISKTVTAWAAMQLVEQGRVRLDAPVAGYLKRWQLPASNFRSDGVTLARLLSHTAGISRHSALEITSAETPSLEQILSSASADGGVKLVAEPGTRWDYSGGGYSITQLLVEEVGGARFADRAHNTVFRPLGMDHSDFELTPTVRAESARCYDSLGELTQSPPFVEVAAAGLYTTLEDLVRFAAAGTAGPHGEPVGRGVLQPATFEHMVARSDGADLGKGHWDGMGYFTETLPDGRLSRGHGGDNRGWSARFEIITESGDGLVVMTNGSNGEAVVRQVRCAWIEWLTGTRPGGDACKKPLWMPLLHALVHGGQDAARASLARWQHDDRYTLDENQLNALGYALLRKQRIDDAVAIFEMNVAAFPRAPNPRDSLGEAYRRAGKRDLAIASYQKVLELAPDNEHARKMLDELANEKP